MERRGRSSPARRRRAAPERGLEGGLAEVLPLPVRLREHRELPEDARELLVDARFEAEPDPLARPGRGVALDRLGGADAPVVPPVEGVSPGLEDLEGEHHVRRGDGAPVVEARLRAQPEGRPGAVVRDLDPFRDEAVGGGRLVRGVLGQGVEEESDRRRRVALDDERIEAVVGRSDRCPAHRAALGRVRVGVVVVGEPDRVPRGLPDGRRVADRALGAGRGSGRDGGDGRDERPGGREE